MNILVAINISCKPEEVFPWIEDEEKAMYWQKKVKRGEIINKTEERIGTKFIEEIEENGKSLEMRGEIINYIQNKLISFRLESKIHRVRVSFSISGDEKKTRLVSESNIHWKFPMSIFSLFFASKIRKNIVQQINAEFSELKKLCESSQ